MALGAMVVTALSAAYSAKETRTQRKNVQAQQAQQNIKLEKQEKKMEADIAKQEAEQAKSLELQRAKQTRKAKRGATGYAGTVLTEGITPGAAVTKRAVLGVG